MEKEVNTKNTNSTMNRIEDSIQSSCVSWFRLQHPGLILLSFPAGYVFGGDKTKRAITGKRMKNMGYTVGTADLFLALPSHPYHGLFIEMKTAKGRQSPAQKDFENRAVMSGYRYITCRSLEDFTLEIKAYLNNINRNL
jgi:hypothetical protein